MNHLNDLLKDKDKSARFVCTIVLLNVDQDYKKFIGVAEGEIVPIQENINGFGYDPIFIPMGYEDRSLAELGEDLKNTISHRFKALSLMRKVLEEL